MRPAFHILKSPGSKCWLLPHVQNYLRDLQPIIIAEPFAGSAVISLSLLNRGYGRRVVLGEKDNRLHKFWDTALNDSDFARRVRLWTHSAFSLPQERQRDFVIESLQEIEESDPGLWVLLRSRSRFNGILQESQHVSTRPLRRWWPSTLAFSLDMLYARRKQIEVTSDGLDVLRYANTANAFAFIDPPYTASQNSAGHRLYRETVDYRELLPLLSKWKGSWQLTGEACPEMVELLGRVFLGRADVEWNFVSMRAGGAAVSREKFELLVSRKSGLKVDTTTGFGRAGLSRLRQIVGGLPQVKRCRPNAA